MKFLDPLDNLEVSDSQLALLCREEVSVINDLLSKGRIPAVEEDGHLFYALDKVLNVIGDYSKKEIFQSPTKTVTFSAHKGGTGKTTLCFQTATFLASLGYKVLIFDLDSQGNTTSQFSDETCEDPNSLNSLYEFCKSLLFSDGSVAASDIVLEVSKGISIIPSNNNTGSIVKVFDQAIRDEASRMSKKEIREGRELSFTFLKSLISHLKTITSSFDFVLIDTSPSIDELNTLAFMMTDLCILPMQPSRFSRNSIMKLIPEFQSACRIVGKEFDTSMIKVVINNNINTRLSKSLMETYEKMAKDLEDTLLSNRIEFSFDLAEAMDSRESLWVYPGNFEGLDGLDDSALVKEKRLRIEELENSINSIVGFVFDIFDALKNPLKANNLENKPAKLKKARRAVWGL